VCGDALTSAPAAASLVITRQARDTTVREGRRAALSVEQVSARARVRVKVRVRARVRVS